MKLEPTGHLFFFNYTKHKIYLLSLFFFNYLFTGIGELNTRKANNPIKKWGKDLNRHFSKDIQMAKKHMKNAQHCLLLEKCKSKPQ